METPFRLVRRDTPLAVEAWLLFANGFDALARTCARAGGGSLPVVHPVRGGFLLVPPSPAAAPPGVVKLRRLSGDLYLPADADLRPALLPDEMVGLTRDTGLVFLPGGLVLAFDPRTPLPPAAWLAPARVRRREWTPFPSPPPLADRLTLIERPAPPSAILEALGGDAPPEPSADAAPAEEDRPPAGSPARRLAEGARLGAGRFLAWLGRVFKNPGLAKRGGDLARKALERVPRLTEKVLGAQEAALRELLRQLQAGDIEKALRRAPVAVPDPDAPPPPVSAGADLGTRDPRYSLRDLLGRGGPGAAWLGGGDVWTALANEYRRLAREAAARGDARRAAYLYGVLLRDPRSAANALLAGGLDRDAAVVLRDRVKDLPAAAAAFARAGDFDEALRLYESLQDYEAAGDLLRKIGDEPAAVDRFERAANRLADRGQYVAAGDLARGKAARPELAADFYRRGWSRDGAEAIACGQRLLKHQLIAGAWADTRTLFDEAETAFAPPRTAEAGQFFNYALNAGRAFLPPDDQDDLADRARRLFAAHLRGRPGHVGQATVSQLFGLGEWAAPVVRDAAAAARVTPRPLALEAATHPPPIRLASGDVRAVVVARETFDIVVATSEAVVRWRPDSGRVEPVFSYRTGNVRGLSADPKGETVFVLHAADGLTTLHCHTLNTATGSFACMGQAVVGLVEEWVYVPPSAAVLGGVPIVAVVTETGQSLYGGPFLRPEPVEPFAAEGKSPHLLVWGGENAAWDWDTLFARCLNWPGGRGRFHTVARWIPAWRPGVPDGVTLSAPAVDWLSAEEGLLKIVAPDVDGVLHWSSFDGRDTQERPTRGASRSHPDRFLAACLVAPGKVAAATGGNEVHWLRVVGSGFEPWAAPTKVNVPSRVVFLASRPTAGEVVAVLADGSAVRLTRP